MLCIGKYIGENFFQKLQLMYNLTLIQKKAINLLIKTFFVKRKKIRRASKKVCCLRKYLSFTSLIFSLLIMWSASDGTCPENFLNQWNVNYFLQNGFL